MQRMLLALSIFLRDHPIPNIDRSYGIHDPEGFSWFGH
jgi:hypothetical protein